MTDDPWGIGPSFADGVVQLTHDEVTILAGILGDATRNRLTVRVSIDGGGLKVAVGHGAWTPPLGVLTR